MHLVRRGTYTKHYVPYSSASTSTVYTIRVVERAFRVNSKRRYASRGGLTYSRLSGRVCVNACAVGLVKYVNISGPSHAGPLSALTRDRWIARGQRNVRTHTREMRTRGGLNKIRKETGERFRRWNKSSETRISWNSDSLIIYSTNDTFKSPSRNDTQLNSVIKEI